MVLSTTWLTTIPSAYGGVYATVIDTRGLRRDPTTAEREAAQQADYITLTEYLQLTGWSVETLDHAIGTHQHPKPVGRRVTPEHTTEPYYSRAQIQVWRERVVTDLTALGFRITP